MALSDNAKLKIFAEEAYADAEKVCNEIKSLTEEERREKLQTGRNYLLNGIRESAAEEIAKSLKENALRVSRRNMELRQEYLLKIDATSELVTKELRLRLEEFVNSDEYAEYLKKKASKIFAAGYLSPQEESSSGAEDDGIEIYHSERDTRHMEELRRALAEMDADVSKVEFIADAGIRIGGLKFHPKRRNIRINETLDDKLEQSAETLDRLISEYVHDEVSSDK